MCPLIVGASFEYHYIYYINIFKELKKSLVNRILMLSICRTVENSRKFLIFITLRSIISIISLSDFSSMLDDCTDVPCMDEVEPSDEVDAVIDADAHGALCACGCFIDADVDETRFDCRPSILKHTTL